MFFAQRHIVFTFGNSTTAILSITRYVFAFAIGVACSTYRQKPEAEFAIDFRVLNNFYPLINAEHHP